MGLLKDIFNKIMRREEEPAEEIPDDVTRDKYLRSLRRENRVLDEEEEKEYLKRKIALRKKIKLRKHLWGLKGRLREQKQQGYFNKYKL